MVKPVILGMVVIYLMLIVGLTGGIGSGKSTVAECFASLGIPIIDADQLSRDLVAPGQPALQEIVQTFGAKVLLPDGNLDRSRLRTIIFNNDYDRIRLEAILHPRIIAAIQSWIQNLRNVSYAILMAPLLLETKHTHLCHRVLVVDIPESLQIHRACKRDDCTMEAISAIIHRQLNRSQRLAAADDIIDNSGDRDNLIIQIKTLHKHYTTLASMMCKIL